MLTTAQQTTLVNGLKAETNATVVAALAVGARNDVYLTEWLNTASTTDAWSNQMTGSDLFQATDITKFNDAAFTAANRDAWRMMLDYAPIDCAKNANRKAILDIWGTTNSIPVLQSCIRKATNAEKYLGGTSATTNTVTALKLNWVGSLGISEVSQALNANGVPG